MPGGTPQIAAPEIFLDQWVDHGKISDEQGPGRPRQTKRLDLPGQIIGDPKVRPEEIQGEPTAAAKQDIQYNPANIFTFAKDVDRDG